MKNYRFLKCRTNSIVLENISELPTAYRFGRHTTIFGQ